MSSNVVAKTEKGGAVSSDATSINYRTISVEYEDDTIQFKMKTGTKLAKLMRSFCEQQKLDLNRVRFFVDERRLRAEQTLEEAGLEDEDVIEVRSEQHGGGKGV